MSNRSDAFQVCEVGEASVLHQILGGHKIAKIERVARAARVRDLLLSLKGAALQMEHDDRMAFAELVELADTVTEMGMLKHAFQAGIPAQRGIED